MHRQIEIALKAPVFDPAHQMDEQYFWFAEPKISLGLTCNIGME